jgi:hypothetical protein
MLMVALGWSIGVLESICMIIVVHHTTNTNTISMTMIMTVTITIRWG